MPGSTWYVVDLASRAVRALVVQPGWDDFPSWSPDGRWIAFSHKSWAVGKYSILAVVPAAGAVTSLRDKDGPRLGGRVITDLDPMWAPDSRAVYFVSTWRLSHQLFRVAVPAAGASTQMAEPTEMIVNDGLAYREHLSLSADARTLAWTSTTGTTRPETDDDRGQVSFNPQRDALACVRYSDGDAMSTPSIDWP